MNRNARLVIALAAVSLVVLPALADPVDNPGFFAWKTGWGNLEFNEASPISRSLGANTGDWEMSLDSAGNVSMDLMTIGEVTISPYTVKVLVTAGSSGGKLLADTPGYNTSLDLTLRVRITGNGVGNNCQTSTFVVDVEGAYVFDGMDFSGQVDLYTGLSGSGAGEWVTVPSLGNVCNGQHSTINSLLGFGVTDGGLRFYRIEARTDDGPYGS